MVSNIKFYCFPSDSVPFALGLPWQVWKPSQHFSLRHFKVFSALISLNQSSWIVWNDNAWKIFVSMENEISTLMVCKKFLSNRAELIALLNLLIIYWSLKKKAKGRISMSFLSSNVQMRKYLIYCPIEQRMTVKWSDRSVLISSSHLLTFLRSMTSCAMGISTVSTALLCNMRWEVHSQS